MANDPRSNEFKAAPATPSGLTPLHQPPHSTQSDSPVWDVPTLTAAAPSMPNSGSQWTTSNRGPSPFMPTFTSPFGLLERIITSLWSRSRTDVVTQTQVSKQDIDDTGPTMTLPNKLKRGRTPEVEEPLKKSKSNDYDFGSNSELSARLTKYPLERTLRVDGIQSNATKAELVFYFRQCLTYASTPPRRFHPAQGSLLNMSLEIRSNTIPAKKAHPGTHLPSSPLCATHMKPCSDSRNAESSV